MLVCSNKTTLMVSAVARLFTPKIADFYEGQYESKGVNFIKGTVLTSFESDSEGKVTFLTAYITESAASLIYFVS